ncbi:hypothetical protein ZHAS_00002590 [Anopheles sinensis]|uniref:Uncharacterized protein n=1 Tax=Anopheles sinensis TaxID=74873 RepID=A0A084WV15_ANOSI|nr:hypothetical protein ZHAS_00002590 [Anopheles sinensis]
MYVTSKVSFRSTASALSQQCLYLAKVIIASAAALLAIRMKPSHHLESRSRRQVVKKGAYMCRTSHNLYASTEHRHGSYGEIGDTDDSMAYGHIQHSPIA